MRGPGAVLRRELVRIARRKQTYAMRFAYSAVLLGVAQWILLDWTWRGYGPTELSMVGRDLFLWYVGLQAFVVVVLAPVLAATGVQEERDARTLDVLALTGIGAGRILFDQVASRIAVLMLTVLAGAPFLGLLTSFGGIAISEVVNALSATLLAGVVLGTWAAFVAIRVRVGPLVPLALAVPYGLMVFGLPALTMVVMSDSERWLAAITPMLALDGHWMAAPFAWIPWAVALPIGWLLAVPVFRIAAGSEDTDDEFGLLSPDIWRIERFKGATLAAAIALALSLIPWWVAMETRVLRGEVRSLVAWAWSAALIVVLHCGALVCAQLAADFIADWTRAPLRMLRRHDLQPRAVWGPPVLWREVATRTSAGARAFPAALALGWLAMRALSWLMFGRDWDTTMGFAALAFLGAWLGAGLTAMSNVLDEKQRGSLEILFMTRETPWRVAVEKTAAPVLVAAPLVALGTLEWASWGGPWWWTHADGHTHHLGPNLLPGVWLLPSIGWATWGLLFAALIGVVSAGAAVRAPSSRAGWPIGLIAGVLVPTWTVVALVICDVLGLGEKLFETMTYVWQPWVDDSAMRCELGGLPPGLVWAICLQCALLPLAWRWLAAGLRPAE